MIKRVLLFSTILLTSSTWQATAQDETDALRYSQLIPQGTGRATGIGGAVGAIGGDFTSLNVNPAGIGVYRSSEFTFTPSLKMGSTNSTYLGNTATDKNTRFNINNLGVVFTNAASGQRYKRSKWKSASFGIGVNRSAEFSSNHTYNGTNNTSSAAEVFLADAIAYPEDIENPFTFAGLGYGSYLVNEDSLGLYQVADFTTGLNQTRTVQQRGGITDFNLSFGGNYQEKLLLGATVGIPILRYQRETTLREEDASGNPDNDFSYFEYREDLTTRGTGINLKLGAIYKFNTNFRAGLALHTPTFFSLTDEFSRSVISNTENLKYYLGEFEVNPETRVDAPVNDYNYSLVTPWRMVLSAASIIGKRGFISLDYEFVDNASAMYVFDAVDSYYESEVNTAIKNMYKGASNIRLGGEVKFDYVMLRAGLGYYGNPYTNANMGSETITASAGVGFRLDNLFVDLGFMHASSKFAEQPYVLIYPDEVIDVPSANIKKGFSNISLTVGTKF